MVLYRSCFLPFVVVVMIFVDRKHVVAFNFARTSSRSLPLGEFYGNGYLPIERVSSATDCRMVSDQSSNNDCEEKFDIQDILQDIPLDENNEIDIDYTSDEDGVDNEELINNKKKIECSASIMLPFSADVAFAAFSDLTRQPSWCKYLHSVEYIGLVNDEGRDGTNESDLLSQDIPLRSSKWTVGVKGLRFSWTASDTRIIRNKRIEWASTSGLKNIGSVVFTPSSSSSQSDSRTHMELCFVFVLPRLVSSLYRRLNIRKYTEEVMLADMLQQFRDVVIEEDL